MPEIHGQENLCSEDTTEQGKMKSSEIPNPKRSQWGGSGDKTLRKAGGREKVTTQDGASMSDA